LRETDAGAATTIEEQSVAACLDENAWSKAPWVGVRPAAGAEQRHGDVSFSSVLVLGHCARRHDDDSGINPARR
jgi:hypothetical protein